MKVILVIIALIGASRAIGAECFEKAGLQNAKQGELTKAFELLRGCEDDPDASAAALFTLVYLYYNDVLIVLTETERAVKSWDLLEQAALTGDEDAVVTLASMYGAGDAELGIEPEPDIQKCLLASTTNSDAPDDEELVSRDAVMKCLTLEPTQRVRPDEHR